MFLSITLDREVIEAYKGYQCVSLIKTHRMICNLTHPGHLVTLTSGQLLTLTLQGHQIYVSMRIDKTNTMVEPVTLAGADARGSAGGAAGRVRSGMCQ